MKNKINIYSNSKKMQRKMSVKKGFTLIETVVAVMIFTVSLLAILNIFIQTSTNNIAKKDMYQAINIGSRKLDSLKTLVNKGASTLPLGVSSFSEVSGKYQINYTVLEEENPKGDALIYDVTATVIWMDHLRNKEREQVISTKIYSF